MNVPNSAAVPDSLPVLHDQLLLVRGFEPTPLPLLRPAVNRRIAMFVSHSASLSRVVEGFRDFALRFSQRWAAAGNRGSERRRRV